MSLPNRVVLTALALLSLSFFVACGSTSNTAVPPPSGGFSASDFNGTYVFTFSGTDVYGSTLSGTDSFFAAAGTLTADGKGGLTGVVDLSDPEAAFVLGLNTSVQTGMAATGNYSVTADGRGSGTFTVNFGGTSFPIGIDFVLISDDHGLITRFDGNGTGSGSLDMQSTGTLGGAYTFAVSGVQDVGGNEEPEEIAGSFALSGASISGISDVNLDGISLGGTTGLSLSGTLGSGAPGTLQISNSSGTFSFDVWMIDGTHMKLIETDEFPILAGDIFTQGTSIAAGNLAYTMSGLDIEGSPMALGGILSTDGGGDITGGEDYNDGGTPGSVSSFNGSYGASFAGGRSTMTLNSIYNGTGALTTNIFAVYPFSADGNAGVEIVEIDSSGTTSGVAYPQTSGATLTASQGYALNFTGSNPNVGEVDEIAEFSSSSTTLPGLYDVNNEGLTQPDLKLDPNNSSTYSVSSGLGTALWPDLQQGDNTVTAALGINIYAVDDSTMLFIETNDGTGQVALGSFQMQTPSSTAAVAGRSFTVRPVILPRVAKRNTHTPMLKKKTTK